MTPSVNTRALVTLLNAIWRERDICYRITRTSKLLCTMQSSISCMRNLFVKNRKFASISFAEARTFSRFFQRALWDLHFSTLSTNNKRNQRKSWRVNFHDHHRCASRSHNETKLKRFGITATTAIGWGQEESMEEDTAMWKVRKPRGAR